MNVDDAGTDRLRAAFATLAERARPSEDCPTPDLLWSAVRGELPRGRIREIGLHAVSCPACAESWRLARDITGEALPETGAAPEPRLAGPYRLWLGWGSVAAAAAAVLVVAVTIPFWRSAEEAGKPAFRAPVEEPIRSLLPGDGALTRGNCLLLWTGPEGARYDVQVATEDLTILASVRDLEAGEYLVPEEALTGLPDGARILWQVEAVLPDGRRLASRTFVTAVE